MGLVEGFAEFALETNSDTVSDEEYNSFQMKFFLLVIVIKVMMVYLVSKFIWPRVVPNVFTGAKTNPGFANLLGLVLIYYLLF
jgi:hypothetical protein|tara:strand:- start:1666 stop:1914 length:249 start_codon:yes stop_codon:yes gene_type:complete